MTYLRKRLFLRNFPPDTFPPPSQSPVHSLHIILHHGDQRRMFFFYGHSISCSFFPMAPALCPPQATILSKSSFFLGIHVHKCLLPGLSAACRSSFSKICSLIISIPHLLLKMFLLGVAFLLQSFPGFICTLSRMLHAE